jgi:hypothetical protein
MDRRNFVKVMLATPILTPLIISSKKTKNDLELFIIGEEPHLFISPLLQEIQKDSLVIHLHSRILIPMKKT